MAETDDVTVFRAPAGRRLLAVVGSVLLVLLAIPVVIAYGWLAAIGVVLILLIIGQLWWVVLRPRLIADREGVTVVAGWQPQHAAWVDIQRTEVGPRGTLIVAKGGREIISRFPYGLRSVSSTARQMEADRAAVFLAARVAWSRRRDASPPPPYVPPSTSPSA
jgi:hypothetical protein